MSGVRTLDDDMWDSVIIGGGPSGLAAASRLAEKGFDVCLIERDEELGGLLDQCIHDGFGTKLFDEAMSGPEFVDIFEKKVENSGVKVMLNSFVDSVEPVKGGHKITNMTPSGVVSLKTKTIVYAIGCREKNRFEIRIGGTRPSGVYTAGTVQRLVNLYGILPGRDVLIVGGGDVGMIVARHLYLEGVDSIKIVYPEEFFAGLPRNAQQCVLDFDIPYEPRTTVRKIHGRKRVVGVELVKVDEDWDPIDGSEEFYPCDCVILSLGLMPYSEQLRTIGALVDKKTSGPVVDEYFQTTVKDVFAVGNLVQIFDYVDDAVLSAYRAADGVEKLLKGENSGEKILDIKAGDNVRSVTPQRMTWSDDEDMMMFFRPEKNMKTPYIRIKGENGRTLKSYRKKFISPSILEKIEVPKDVIRGQKEVILRVG